MMVFSVANSGFTLYFSPRAGDFEKANRVIHQGGKGKLSEVRS